MPLSVHRHVDAPPDAVWSVLTDLDAWPVWGPTVTRAALDDDGPFSIGSTGRVWTPVGVPLPFRVTELDAGRHWAWRVAGVPATTHTVEPEGDGCRLSMAAPLWAPAYLPVLALALTRIDALVARR